MCPVQQEYSTEIPNTSLMADLWVFLNGIPSNNDTLVQILQIMSCHVVDTNIFGFSMVCSRYVTICTSLITLELKTLLSNKTFFFIQSKAPSFTITLLCSLVLTL